MASNRVGLVIGAVFGLIYVVVNAAALGALVGPALQVLGVAAFMGLLVVLYRSPQEPADTPGGAIRFGRGYWSVVAAEVVAFVAGIAMLNGPLGLPLAVLPWVTFVVGVHFLGLATVWRAPSLLWLGVGMALCGVAGLAAAALGAPTAAIAAVAGVAPGALLLAGSWWAAIRGVARPEVCSRGCRVTGGS